MKALATLLSLSLVSQSMPLFIAPLLPITSPPGSISRYQPYAMIQLGTPPQTFKVLLDTGSSASFVNKVGCKGAQSQAFFDPQKSSTFKSQPGKFSYSFPPDKYKGGFATDTLSIGNLTVKNYNFGLVTSETLDKGEGDFDGILGLAANDGEEKSTFQDALKLAGITQFAFDYPRNISLNGTFTMGKDTNTQQQSLQCTSEYWDVGDFSIYVGTTLIAKVKGRPNYTYLDTGTDTFYIPSREGGDLCKAIGAHINNDECVAECSSILQNFTLQFKGGVVLNVNTNDGFIYPSLDGKRCIVAIDPTAGSREWGIGLVILRQFHTVWDFARNVVTFS